MISQNDGRIPGRFSKEIWIKTPDEEVEDQENTFSQAVVCFKIVRLVGQNEAVLLS